MGSYDRIAQSLKAKLEPKPNDSNRISTGKEWKPGDEMRSKRIDDKIIRHTIFYAYASALLIQIEPYTQIEWEWKSVEHKNEWE
jgi:hypothetical protein